MHTFKMQSSSSDSANYVFVKPNVVGAGGGDKKDQWSMVLHFSLDRQSVFCCVENFAVFHFFKKTNTIIFYSSGTFWCLGENGSYSEV